ncbi:MAG: transglycosylase SLT domain-containing protein [Rhodobacteraceae bacterium]|nr:transglycosylase SLT domain-containing protein [Paracoccaceae bacterium]
MRDLSSALLIVLLVALVASCGSFGRKPPRDLGNACSIVTQRPDFRRAFQKAERRWNVPVHTQMAIIYQESRFVGTAQPPRRMWLGFFPGRRASTAYGYAQVLDGTWDDYTKSTGRRWASRNDIGDAADFIGWYMNQTRKRNGVALSDTRNQYLAYHEGHTGYGRGSYRGKRALLRTAAAVAERARRYQRQLARCRAL